MGRGLPAGGHSRRMTAKGECTAYSTRILLKRLWTQRYRYTLARRRRKDEDVQRLKRRQRPWQNWRYTGVLASCIDASISPVQRRHGTEEQQRWATQGHKITTQVSPPCPIDASCRCARTLSRLSWHLLYRVCGASCPPFVLSGNPRARPAADPTWPAADKLPLPCPGFDLLTSLSCCPRSLPQSPACGQVADGGSLVIRLDGRSQRECEGLSSRESPRHRFGQTREKSSRVEGHHLRSQGHSSSVPTARPQAAPLGVPFADVGLTLYAAIRETHPGQRRLSVGTLWHDVVGRSSRDTDDGNNQARKIKKEERNVSAGRNVSSPATRDARTDSNPERRPSHLEDPTYCSCFTVHTCTPWGRSISVSGGKL